MKSQSTIHNKNPKSYQTEDNHLTKQAHYLLPTLEWESGLQRWRARTLSLDSRTGKTICLSTLFTEFNPFSVPWLSKIQHTVWLYQRSKNIWLQLEKFYLSLLGGNVMTGDSGYPHSAVFLQQPKFGWPKINTTSMSDFLFIPSLEHSYECRIQHSI